MYKKLLLLIMVLGLLQGNFTLAAGLNNEDKNMTREEICKDNFRQHFKGEALPKTGNDTEMMAILQKYIFGEVFTIGNLEMKTREMITVVSLSVQQTLPQT